MSTLLNQKCINNGYEVNIIVSGWVHIYQNYDLVSKKVCGVA